MFISDVKHAVRVCLWADVVPQLEGHAGTGKTELVYQIGEDWVDPFTGEKGLHVMGLYCATQEITDLIGFPIKIWKLSGNPVVEGMHEPGAITTGWAPPSWWPEVSSEEDAKDKEFIKKMTAEGSSKEQIEAFWNRPRRILFLDEVRRSAREVMQALYPLILSKTLHTHSLPRGTRIVTADNPSGAYDVRMPDLAFMSRFCHMEVETNIGNWHDYAIRTGINSRIRNYLVANPTFLNNLPKDLDKEKVVFEPIARSRNWTLVDRVMTRGHRGLDGLSPEDQTKILKQVVKGLVGFAPMEHFFNFQDDCLNFDDILTGKGDIAKALEGKTPTDKNKILEKLMIEVSGTMKARKYDEKEAERLAKFVVQMESKERATAILQTIFLLKNSTRAEEHLDTKWTDFLVKNPATREILAHLLKKSNK